ncbi:hypothetical protein Tco_0864688 [Tanacetum coccineum]
MSDSENSTVTYTVVSSPFEDWFHHHLLHTGPEEPAVTSPDFVPEPMYPEYIPQEDGILPAEEQPLPAAASPTANSPGYVPKSDLEEELAEDDEDPEEDPADYPADREDDDDDEDEDEGEEEEEDLYPC